MSVKGGASILDERYDPHTFSKELDNIESLCKFLGKIEQSLSQASMQSLLLNVDLVTMFDPIMSEQLQKSTGECKDCAERISKQQHKEPSQ